MVVAAHRNIAIRLRGKIFALSSSLVNRNGDIDPDLHRAECSKRDG